MIHDSEAKAEQSPYGLRMGTCGWQHENWVGSFYPEDLPEDWRLGYYANEFSAVLVPRSEWQPGAGFDMDSWHDDVAEQFRFYMEWPFDSVDDQDQALFFEQCQRLGELLGGIIVHQDIQLTTDLPIYFSHSKGSLIQQLWSGKNHAQSGVALMELAGWDMRAQRKCLEDFAASTDDPQCVLITDASIDIESLRNFKTLIELLGL